MTSQSEKRIASQIESTTFEIKYVTDDLVKAYKDLADTTAIYATRAKEANFTDLGHLRMYTENVLELTTRLKAANEKLTLLNWLTASAKAN